MVTSLLKLSTELQDEFEPQTTCIPFEIDLTDVSYLHLVRFHLVLVVCEPEVGVQLDMILGSSCHHMTKSPHQIGY